MDEYREFIASKTPRAPMDGLCHVPHLAPHLFDYQRDCVDFALRAGRFGLFLDTGLGKTACELEFAHQAAQATNGRALILTPLAVARQIEREGHRFGYSARVARSADDVRDGITVCNYDMLDKLDAAAFGAVVLDESSILKNFNGATTRNLISTFSSTPFRMAATATPAPNDHMELGTHAEFLGVMSAQEMLMRFFINDTATGSQQWRIKRHGVNAFWDWMASWSRMAQSPEDLGYDGSRFVLPPMQVIRHKAAGDIRAPAGALFAEEISATTMHEVKRQTADARADIIAALAVGNDRSWVIWCDTDYESDALKARMPDAGEVRGSDTVAKKEAALAAFADGELRILITKPSVCGYGLNWQHCADMAFVGRSFSYEAWYQAVRRCWRFGQIKPVNVHLVVAEGEDQIGRVLDRKAADHVSMKAAMASAMKRANARAVSIKTIYQPHHEAEVPTWLSVA